jgi:hypothetical protein
LLACLPTVLKPLAECQHKHYYSTAPRKEHDAVLFHFSIQGQALGTGFVPVFIINLYSRRRDVVATRVMQINFPSHRFSGDSCFIFSAV